MNDPSAPAPSSLPRRLPGRSLLLAGIGIAVLGIALYAIEVSLQRLATPWYLPCSAMLGAVLIALSLLRARSMWRIAALAAVVVLAGLQWTFLIALRLPGYSGPIAVGQPFPAFTTQKADGGLFTEHDFEGNENGVVVFFRGRW